MSKTAGELIFRVTIDGKEGNATLKMTEQNVSQLLNAIKKTEVTTGGANKGLSQMNNTMGQLGWVMGDANMFLVNFRMGMMSVANNIPMVVQGLAMVRAEAAATGQSFKALAMQSLMGPGGLMLGINLLMFALTALPYLFGDTTEAVKDQAEEIKKLKNEYAGLTKAQLDYYLQGVEEKIFEMEQKAGPRGTVTVGNYSPGLNQTVYTSRKQTDEELFGEEYQAYKLYLEKREMLRAQMAKKGQLAELEDQLRLNEKKLKDLGEGNFGLLVPGAKTVQEAQDKVRGWIEFNKKQIEAITGEKKKGRSKELDEEEKLRKELAVINAEHGKAELVKLKQWYDERLKIVKGNTSLLKELDEAYIKQKNEIYVKSFSRLRGNDKLIEQDLGTMEERWRMKQEDSGKRNLFEMRPVLNTPEVKSSLEVLYELNPEMDAAGQAVNSLQHGFRNMGNELSTALGRGVVLFKQANSMAQIFANSLLKIAVQAMAIFALRSFMNAVGVPADIQKIIFPTSQPLAGGGNDSRVIPIGRMRENIPPQISINISQEPIVRGNDIYLINKNVGKLRKEFG